jgi:hypothetical protein
MKKQKRQIPLKAIGVTTALKGCGISVESEKYNSNIDFQKPYALFKKV